MSNTQQEYSSILIVEDEDEIREALCDYLGSLGNTPEAFDNAEDALKRMKTAQFDMVISDMKLPGMDGIAFSQKIKRESPETDIIVITAFGNVPSALKAIEFGAEDYLLKPFSLETLKHTIDKIAEKRHLKRENRMYQRELESMIAARRKEIRAAGKNLGETFYKTIYILGNALESREQFLFGRTERLTILALRTAETLKWEQSRLKQVLLGAPISDIGKLTIPETILKKAGPLTEDESEELRSHILAGVQVVRTLTHFKEVSPVIKHHHEKYDGSGYPDGLVGDEIPRSARLLAICDTYDALTHQRPWRPARSHEKSLEEIRKLSGTAFDPDYVVAFEATVNKHKLDLLVGTKPTKMFYELTFPILRELDF